MDDSNSNGVSGSIPKRAAYPSDVNRIPTRLMIENKPLYAAPGHQRRDPIRTLTTWVLLACAHDTRRL